MAGNKRMKSRAPLTLEAGAEIAVESRSAKRARSDRGFIGRTGTVLCVHYSVDGEARVRVALTATFAAGYSREWMWSSEVRVIAAAPKLAAA